MQDTEINPKQRIENRRRILKQAGDGPGSKPGQSDEPTPLECVIYRRVNPEPMKMKSENGQPKYVMTNMEGFPLLKMLKRSAITQAQYEAGLRYFADHQINRTDGSNFGAMIQGLANTVQATAPEMEEKFWGRTMHVSQSRVKKSQDGLIAMKLDVASRLHQVHSRLSSLAELALDIVVLEEKDPIQIAEVLREDRRCGPFAIRVALFELMAVYQAIDMEVRIEKGAKKNRKASSRSEKN